MTERREFEQKYSSKWKSLANFMKNNTGLKISGVAKAGSRRRGEHEDISDLDIIFKIPTNPSKEFIYPILVEKLEKGYRNANVRQGSSKNVVKMDYENLHFDIALRTEAEFDKQVQNYKLETI